VIKESHPIPMTKRDNCQAAIAQLLDIGCRVVAQTVAKVHLVAEEL
jgi:hypothetical protein